MTPFDTFYVRVIVKYLSYMDIVVISLGNIRNVLMSLDRFLLQHQNIMGRSLPFVDVVHLSNKATTILLNVAGNTAVKKA